MNRKFIIIMLLVAVVAAILMAAFVVKPGEARTFPADCRRYEEVIGAGNAEYTGYAGTIMEYCGVVLRISLDKGNTYQYIKVKVGKPLASRLFSITWTKNKWFHLKQKCDGIFCPILKADVYLRKANQPPCTWCP